MEKRRINGNVSLLADMPWQFSVTLAAVMFVVIKWIIPASVQSPSLSHLAEFLSESAPMAVSPLLLMSGFSFFRSKVRFQSGSEATCDSINTHDHTEWSIGLLRILEWKRFEMLCAEYFRVLGKRVETRSIDVDAKVNFRIYADRFKALEYVIQCKALGKMVGTKPIRELLEITENEFAGKGIFMTTSSFTEDAKKYGAEHRDKLFLIDGEKFLAMILKLPQDKQQNLLIYATEGDYTTPTCPTCGTKMVWRKKGSLWGCKNYPMCKSTLKVVHT